MRYKFLLILMLLSLSASSQEIRVRGIRKIRPVDNGRYMITGVVPGTRYLLVTGEGYRGLSLIDSRNGNIRQINTDQGAGYEPAATADGRNLIYRTDDFSGGRKLTSVYKYNLESGRSEVLIDRERDVLSPSVSGNSVFIRAGKTTRMESLDSLTQKSKMIETFVVIEDMIPVLYHDGERKPLKPNGEGYYIWASLSPDGSKIVYNYQGRGTYICDNEGNVLHNLGRIDAPRWLNDSIIIGMDDRDDGYRIISSELVYYSLPQGSRKILTLTPDRAEIYPMPFDSGRKIVFSSQDGRLYVMKIRIR